MTCDAICREKKILKVMVVRKEHNDPNLVVKTTKKYSPSKRKKSTSSYSVLYREVRQQICGQYSYMYISYKC